MQLKFGDQPATIVTRVVRPPEDATKDGVLRNYEILPLTPFNGGTVEVQAALLAMQGTDYLGVVIDVLQDFSSLVAAPLGQVLAVADKVANGLDTIMQATDGDARLPYHDTFVGALDKLDLEAAVAAERNLKTAIFRCDDLARFDRPRVWDGISKEIEDLKSSYGMGAKGVLSHTLDEVMAAWAVPMAEVESLAAFSALQP